METGCKSVRFGDRDKQTVSMHEHDCRLTAFSLAVLAENGDPWLSAFVAKSGRAWYKRASTGAFAKSCGRRAMGLFGGKDWNVIAIIYERREMYRVNGQRGKGSGATKCRDGAKNHERTIYWAVFNQKRAFVEGGGGLGEKMVTTDIIARLKREFSTNATVTGILGILERGESAMIAKPLAFGGYPRPDNTSEEP
jgi:hypothetical protein